MQGGKEIIYALTSRRWRRWWRITSVCARIVESALSTSMATFISSSLGECLRAGAKTDVGGNLSSELLLAIATGCLCLRPAARWLRECTSCRRTRRRSLARLSLPTGSTDDDVPRTTGSVEMEGSSTLGVCGRERGGGSKPRRTGEIGAIVRSGRSRRSPVRVWLAPWHNRPESGAGRCSSGEGECQPECHPASSQRSAATASELPGRVSEAKR